MYVINTTFERPDPKLVARARDTWACIAGQVAGRCCVMDSGIRPLRRDWRFAGPALTVTSDDPSDTLVHRVATQYVEPGDVIVIDAGGRMNTSCWGATMAWAAKESGAVAVVADGVVLTTELLIDHEGLPVFCRGSTARWVGGEGPGSMNVPIVCGGVIVNPGDIILGDEDGVVVLPRERAEAILDGAGQQRLDPYPPVSRKVPFGERGLQERLRGMEGIEWR
jgi:4-hydroxy-4-methyl-2-oxoglutarate aldolase